ncbi:MAG TPA: dihydrofolate reductase family protein [Nakamurella sp.]
MSTVTVVCNLTLDGVMQGPGRPDEDRRGGFTHGGWAVPYSSDAMGRVFEGMGQQAGRSGAMLFGRRTYEDFAGFWPNQPDNPFTDPLNRTQKYVVSTTLADPLPWMNSTVLAGDAAKAVAALKDEEPERDLVILGSGQLIRSLLPDGLIDEFTLLIHPLVLGAGQRLFTEGSEAALELIDSVGTSTGVVLARYRRAQ